VKSSQTLTRDIVVAKTCNCAISKHAGSGRAQKSVGEITKLSRVFPPISSVFYRFLSALQQNRAQSGLLYLFYNKKKERIIFFNFQTKVYYPNGQKGGVSLHLFSDKIR